MADNVFKKYRARIAREGILKAFLLSGSIAFGALSLTVLICWLAGFKAGLWIGLGVFAALLAGLTPLLYLKLYRPTTKAIAQRVDRLGLEERVLTMVELENDASYVAMKQREDTMKALGSVDHMLVKLAVSAALVITFGVGVFFGTSMLTVGSLYVADVIPGGAELLMGEYIPRTYTVTYTANKGGSIVMYTDDWSEEPALAQELIVTEGEDAPAVLAIGDSEHIFVGWSDGVTEAYRQDLDVQGNITVSAVFLAFEDSVEEAENPSFYVPNMDWPKNDNDAPSDPDTPPKYSPPPTGSGNGGSSGDNSGNINDGSTYYGDSFDQAQQEAMDRLGSDSSMGGDLSGGINDYFNSIQDGGSGDPGSGLGPGSGLNP